MGADKVKKMLAPEEMSLLQDIGASIQALLQMNAGEAQAEGGGEQATMSMVAEEDDKAEKADGLDAIMEKVAAGEALTPEEQEMLGAALNAAKEKDEYAEKSNDGPTANERGEERTEDPSKINDESINLAKSLLGLINHNQPAQKAYGPDVQAVIAKSLKPLINDVQSMKGAMSAILDDLGYAEAATQVEKEIQKGAAKVQKSTGMTPAGSVDAENFAALIGKSVADQIHKSNDARQYGGNDIGDVRKEFRSSMKALFANMPVKRPQ